MHYIPNNAAAEAEMLAALGVQHFEDLLTNIPAKILQQCQINLPAALSESELAKMVTAVASRNQDSESKISFMGGGVYDHFIPAVVDFLISRSEFYTAYTPYQPEVSQGTLQAIYEYQSLICQLTDMEVANASLYDGATALAEAAMMAGNLTNRKLFLVSPLISPAALSVLQTYCAARDYQIKFLPEKDGTTFWQSLSRPAPYQQGQGLSALSEQDELNEQIAAVIVQSLNFLGYIENLEGLADIVHQHKALLVISVDPLSLAILKTPGELGADIAVAEGQSLGIHQSFGGPFLGILATRRAYIRSLPGRLVGETVDVDGRRGYVLVLQTREQHIRREKATSNICTNEGLMALAATIYLSLMGKNGLKRAAELCLNNSHYLAEKIAALPGYAVPNQAPFFKEFVVITPQPAERIVSAATEAGFLAGIDLGQYRKEWQNHLLIAVTERRTLAEMDDFVKFLGKF